MRSRNHLALFMALRCVFTIVILLALSLCAYPSGAIDEFELANLPMTESYIYYEISGGEITIRYYGSLEPDAVIPSAINGLPVTAIGDFAFWSCEVTGITLPETIRSIGRGAFEHCSGLNEIIIPAGVNHIGEVPFLGCNIKEIIVADGNESSRKPSTRFWNRRATPRPSLRNCWRT